MFVTGNLTAIRAAKQTTNTIPIVMVTNADPVATKLIDSLARPGGNITGLTNLNRDLSAKRLELFKEIAPNISRVESFGIRLMKARLSDLRNMRLRRNI